MKNKIKIILFIVFLGFIVYLLRFSPASYYFFAEEGKAVFSQKFQFYLNHLGFWAPFIFVGFYVLSIMFFIPASVFATIGGLIFGHWFGLLLNLISVTIGGVFSFFTSRYLLRDAIAKIMQKGRFKQLDDAVEKHGLSIMIYLRLMFIPFTYLSFAGGLSKMKFKDFFWGTIIGTVPGITVVTFLAVAIKQLIVTYKTPMDVLRPDIIIPVLLFVISFFIPIIIRRYKNKFNVSDDIEKEVEG
ncbi:MAG: TVP38/TMEM64 family protein [Candidatus Goldbacteria bacterium]|nr:TVP38/TMEM64 family protein [Candidatus Goldiibacteriota bacterium]